MKPLFATLKRNHYTSNQSRPDVVDERHLYSEMGIDFDNLVKSNYAYKNTCAARMSLALLKSGVAIRGRLKIKTGPFAGRSIEPGAKLLADQLKLPTVLGKPEIFPARDAEKKLKGRHGIVFFSKIGGFSGDHIDLVETLGGYNACNSFCYFDSKEVWFWELP